jgi:hypothetical protein
MIVIQDYILPRSGTSCPLLVLILHTVVISWMILLIIEDLLAGTMEKVPAEVWA